MKPIFIEEKKSIIQNPKLLIIFLFIFIVGVYNRLSYETIYTNIKLKHTPLEIQSKVYFIKAVHIQTTYIRPLNVVFEMDSWLIKPLVKLREYYIEKGNNIFQSETQKSLKSFIKEKYID